jgi:3-hydroxypropionyl-CoA synthetase (ADP-forming)
MIMGAFKQAGIISVDSYQQLVGVLKALAWQPVAKGSKIGMCSNGAGPIVVSFDKIEKEKLVIGKISPQRIKKIQEHFPPLYIIAKKGNPIDITGGATANDYRFIIQEFMNEVNVDIIMLWFAFQDEPLKEIIIDYLAEFSKKKSKPILVGCNGGTYTKNISKFIEEKNIPVYDNIEIWLAAAHALSYYNK